MWSPNSRVSFSHYSLSRADDADRATALIPKKNKRISEGSMTTYFRISSGILIELTLIVSCSVTKILRVDDVDRKQSPLGVVRQASAIGNSAAHAALAFRSYCLPEVRISFRNSRTRTSLLLCPARILRRCPLPSKSRRVMWPTPCSAANRRPLLWTSGALGIRASTALSRNNPASRSKPLPEAIRPLGPLHDGAQVCRHPDRGRPR